ncbi:MAG: E3 binding domain-containing protein [Anaerolineales bacterium]|nr:E3 binding domain-containing protein [Anaerolineales bacterium]
MSTNVVVPILGEAIGEARVAAWLKQPGDSVRRGDELAELETDKAMLMLESPADGVLLEVLAPAGAMVVTGDLLARVGQQGEATETTKQPPEPAAPPQVTRAVEDAHQAVSLPAASGERRQRISPAARRLARDNGLDPAQLAPALPGGRVTTQDVLRHLSSAPGAPEIPQRRVLMNAVQRATASRMAQCE